MKLDDINVNVEIKGVVETRFEFLKFAAQAHPDSQPWELIEAADEYMRYALTGKTDGEADVKQEGIGGA